MLCNLLKLQLLWSLLNKNYCQISYSTKVLEFLEEKLNKKLDTNLFLFEETNRQKEFPSVCFSSDGPYCNHLNGKSLAGRQEKHNQKYLDILRLTKESFIKKGKAILASKKKYDEMRENDYNRNDEYVFGDKSRVLLDEALYPDVYRREANYRFTFQTFDLLKNKVVYHQNLDINFPIELAKILSEDSLKLFMTYMDYSRYSQNKNEWKFTCKFQNIYQPSSHMLYEEKGDTESFVKKSFKNFGHWSFDSEIAKDEVKWGINYPKNQYVYTKDLPGKLKFDFPVHFRFMFLRSSKENTEAANKDDKGGSFFGDRLNYFKGNDSNTKQDSMTLVNDGTNLEHDFKTNNNGNMSYIIVKYYDKVIKQWVLNLDSMENKHWKRINFESVKESDSNPINEIVFGPNLSIDNIDFYVNYSWIEDNMLIHHMFQDQVWWFDEKFMQPKSPETEENSSDDKKESQEREESISENLLEKDTNDKVEVTSSDNQQDIKIEQEKTDESTLESLPEKNANEKVNSTPTANKEEIQKGNQEKDTNAKADANNYGTTVEMNNATGSDIKQEIQKEEPIQEDPSQQGSNSKLNVTGSNTNQETKKEQDEPALENLSNQAINNKIGLNDSLTTQEENEAKQKELNDYFNKDPIDEVEVTDSIINQEAKTDQKDQIESKVTEQLADDSFYDEGLERLKKQYHNYEYNNDENADSNDDAIQHELGRQLDEPRRSDEGNQIAHENSSAGVGNSMDQIKYSKSDRKIIDPKKINSNTIASNITSDNVVSENQNLNEKGNNSETAQSNVHEKNTVSETPDNESDMADNKNSQSKSSEEDQFSYSQIAALLDYVKNAFREVHNLSHSEIREISNIVEILKNLSTYKKELTSIADEISEMIKNRNLQSTLQINEQMQKKNKLLKKMIETFQNKHEQIMQESNLNNDEQIMQESKLNKNEQKMQESDSKKTGDKVNYSSSENNVAKQENKTKGIKLSQRKGLSSLSIDSVSGKSKLITVHRIYYLWKQQKLLEEIYSEDPSSSLKPNFELVEDILDELIKNQMESFQNHQSHEMNPGISKSFRQSQYKQFQINYEQDKSYIQSGEKNPYAEEENQILDDLDIEKIYDVVTDQEQIDTLMQAKPEYQDILRAKEMILSKGNKIEPQDLFNKVYYSQLEESMEKIIALLSQDEVRDLQNGKLMNNDKVMREFIEKELKNQGLLNKESLEKFLKQNEDSDFNFRSEKSGEALVSSENESEQ